MRSKGSKTVEVLKTSAVLVGAGAFGGEGGLLPYYRPRRPPADPVEDERRKTKAAQRRERQREKRAEQVRRSRQDSFRRAVRCRSTLRCPCCFRRSDEIGGPEDVAYDLTVRGGA